MKEKHFLIFDIVILLMISNVCAHAVSVQEEIDIGKKMNAEIMKKYRQTSDEEANKQIQEIGNKLTPYISRKQIPYVFTIIKDKELNAFAVPGGYVYFTDSLWNVMNYDERAGVLAHEIIHVDGRHSIDAMQKSQTKRTFTAIVLVLLKANNIVFNIADMVNSLSELKYSRGDERQADEFGTLLLQKAGLNPTGVLMSMRKIMRFGGGSNHPKIFLSHPPTKERLDYITALLNKKGIPNTPEDVKIVENQYMIGKVTQYNPKNTPLTICFDSNQMLQDKSFVWVMKKGWDSKYENMVDVPVARGSIEIKDEKNLAMLLLLPEYSSKDVAVGSVVCYNNSDTGYTKLGELIPAASKAELVFYNETKFMRAYAVQTVWDYKINVPVDKNVGYLGIYDASNKPTYAAITNPGYSWTFPNGGRSFLAPVADPDDSKWIGFVIGVDKKGKVLVRTNIALTNNQTYLIAQPMWDNTKLEERVVGKASLGSVSTELSIASFTKGWGIDSINAGFDIYIP